MKKILCIIRVSTLKQEMESQRNDMLKWLTGMGYTEEEIEVKDYEGASARSLNDKYLNMLADIKRITTTTTIKTVAVWHINRLGRVESKLMEMKEFFVKNKIQLLVKQSNVTLLDENGNLTTGGSLVFSMFAAMVAEETEEMMQKFDRGKAQRRAEGKTDGSTLPLGYFVKEDKTIDIDEKGAEIVREIFNTYSTGEWSTTRLATELNERGIVDPETGAKFTQSRVANILSKKAYTGQTGTKRVGKKGEKKTVVNEKRTLPAIITPELFATCEALRKGAKVARKHNYTSAYLCNKLILCSCGYHFTASNTVYRCFKEHDEMVKAVSENERKHHTGVTLNIDMMDGLIWKLAADMEMGKLLNDNCNSVSEYKEQLSTAEGKLAAAKDKLSKFDKKRDEVTDMVIDGMLTKEKAKQKLQKIDNDENTLKAEIDAIKADIDRLTNIVVGLQHPTIDMAALMYDNLPEQVEKKRAIVRTHIHHIEVSEWQTTKTASIKAADIFTVKVQSKEKRYLTITVFDNYGGQYEYRYFPRWSFGKSRLEEKIDGGWGAVILKDAA